MKQKKRKVTGSDGTHPEMIKVVVEKDLAGLHLVKTAFLKQTL